MAFDYVKEGKNEKAADQDEPPHRKALQEFQKTMAHVVTAARMQLTDHMG